MKPKGNYDLIHTIRIEDAPQQKTLLYVQARIDNTQESSMVSLSIVSIVSSVTSMILKTSLYSHSEEEKGNRNRNTVIPAPCHAKKGRRIHDTPVR
jgi:hypothetical protein